MDLLRGALVAPARSSPDDSHFYTARPLLAIGSVLNLGSPDSYQGSSSAWGGGPGAGVRTE